MKTLKSNVLLRRMLNSKVFKLTTKQKWEN